MNSIPENTDAINTTNDISNINVDTYLTENDNENVKNIIKLLITNNKEIKDILNIINVITADNKINSDDIKSIIVLIEKLVKLKNSEIELKTELTYVELLNIVRIIFKIVVDKKVVTVEKDEQLLKNINEVIDILIKEEKVIKKLCCFCW